MARPRNFSSPLLTLAAVVLVIAALHLAKEILVPIALAIFFSFLLTPLANRLERWGLGRIPSVVSVVTVSFAVLGLLGWIATVQLVDLGSQLPQYKTQLIRKINEIRPSSSTLKDISKTLEDVQKSIEKEKPEPGESGTGKQGGAETNSTQPISSGQQLSAPTGNSETPSTDLAAAPDTMNSDSIWSWASGFRRPPADRKTREPVDVRLVGTPPSPLRQMMDWFGPLMAPLATAGIAVILVIFILLQREDQRNRLLQLFGSSHLHATTEALTDVTQRVSRYLRMQFLINASYGLAVALGMALIGVPGAVMWGVLSGALRFLPYVGPWLSAIMPLFVSVATSEGWRQPIEVMVCFAVLELIVNNVAEPLLYGHSTGVSGVGVIVAAIFWTWIWGPVGLVLAMPLTVCTVVMAKYVPSLRFLAILLGDEPAMSNEQRVYQRLLAGDTDEARALTLAALKSSPLIEIYDRILIPALELAERDRHAGLLTEEQESDIEETARELIDELGVTARIEAAKNQPERSAHRARIMCIPLRDDADEISGTMLKQLLEMDGFEVELAAAESLTGELVDSITEKNIDIAVISILPPLPARYSRLLCSRLRGRYPELPIVVGYWCGECPPDLERRLCADAGETATTLAAARERIMALCTTQPQIVEKVG